MAETNGKRTTNTILIIVAIVGSLTGVSGFTYGMAATRYAEKAVAFEAFKKESSDDRRGLDKRITALEQCQQSVLEGLRENKALLLELLGRKGEIP
jgi:hypothetical protein